MSVNLNFRTEEATREAIDKLAADMDRDRSWVINQAVKEYLEENAWHIEKILEGRHAIERGDYVTLEEAREYFRKKFERLANEKRAK